MLKLILLFKILIFCFIQNIYSQTNSEFSSAFKDSLLIKIESSETDSSKCELAIYYYKIYYDSIFSSELINYAIDKALISNNLYYENESYNQVARKILEKHGVNNEFHIWKEKIKDVNIRQNDYYTYFAIKEAEICWYIEKGKYEYTLESIKDFSNEVEQLNNNRGRVICKLLLSTLYYMKQQDDKLLVNNIELLNMPEINFREKLLALFQIISSYTATKDYNEAIIYLDMAYNELEKNTSENDNYKINRINFLTLEFLYCTVFREIPNAELLNLHLKKADNILRDDDGDLNRSKYFHNLGAYQYLINDFDNSIESYDKAIKYRSKVSTNPVNINKLNIYKAISLGAKGNLDEAYNLMQDAVSVNDSIYRSILKNQELILAENYRMEMANIRAEKIKKTLNYSLVIIVFIIVLIVIYFIIRLFYLNVRLSESKRDIYESYLLTKRLDKQKEIFVKNISKEIKEPLNNIINISAELSSEKNEDIEYINYQSVNIKKNASKLMFLVNSILDLSRLESGMMKFNFEEINIESFINTLIFQHNSQFEKTIKFNSKYPEFSYKADSARFEKLIDSYIQANVNNQDIDISLLKGDDNSAILKIRGTVLANNCDKDIEVGILRNINNIVIEKFGWELISDGKNEVKIIMPQDI